MTVDAAFAPAWWLPGPHAQTIGGSLLRRHDRVTTERERLELADGDFLDLDWAVVANGWTALPEAPLVLVLHGMEGTGTAGYVLEMERALARVRLASVALNFRSCSGEPNRLSRFYHSGETGDLDVVLATLRRRFPDRPLGAVGFSLGANVLLKYLGECGRGDRRTGVDAAAAISVPFDLAAGLGKLEHGISRIYQLYLIRKLRRKVRAKAALLRDLCDVDRLLSTGSIREFDELLTAPLNGFRDAADYYERSSCGQFLAYVAVPTLLLHAVDDPFLPAAAIARRDVAVNPWLEAVFPPRGGHVGFVSGPPWRPRFWAQQTAAEHLARHLVASPGAG